MKLNRLFYVHSIANLIFSMHICYQLQSTERRSSEYHFRDSQIQNRNRCVTTAQLRIEEPRKADTQYLVMNLRAHTQILIFSVISLPRRLTNEKKERKRAHLRRTGVGLRVSRGGHSYLFPPPQISNRDGEVSTVAKFRVLESIRGRRETREIKFVEEVTSERENQQKKLVTAC